MPQLTSLLGYAADEWLSDPTLWVAAIHPDDRERVIREDSDATETGKRFHSEYRMLSRESSVRWFRDEAVFVEEPTTGARAGVGEQDFIVGLVGAVDLFGGDGDHSHGAAAADREQREGDGQEMCRVGERAHVFLTP